MPYHRVHSPRAIAEHLVAFMELGKKVCCNLSQFVQGGATSANTVHSYASQRGGSFELPTLFKSPTQYKSNSKHFLN